MVTELEPDLYGIAAAPTVGIGQLTKLLRTPAGNLLWDPIGYLDEAGVAAVAASSGPVVAIVASHPHMYGVQVEWSRALGGVPILVPEADAQWVARPDDAIQHVERHPGGPARGHAVPAGRALPGQHGRALGGRRRGRRACCSASDTIFANPDRVSVSFMRSYPNRIPLSAAVVERVATPSSEYAFDRLYGNFDNVIPTDAAGVVRRSADRHMAWVRGDFDHLT